MARPRPGTSDFAVTMLNVRRFITVLHCQSGEKERYGDAGPELVEARVGAAAGNHGQTGGVAAIARSVLAPPAPVTAASARAVARPAALTTVLFLVIVAGAAVLRLWQLDQFPPGLNHDEGVNALDVEAIIAGARPIFLPNNNGREVLFMYGEAVLGALFGVSPWSLRLTAALVGTGTVAATFGLACAWFGRRVGLVAAGLLAVAFWHVVLSRVGLRAIMAPLFYVLVFWTLAVALRGRRTRAYVLAGVFLGLAQYTYISARLLPAILLVIGLALFWQERRVERPALPLFGELCLTAVVAALVALPEAIYFLRHPDTLAGRTDQVLVFNAHPAIIGQPITLQQSVERTLGMFWVQGDANWLHNIAGLPMLDPPMTVLFLLGSATCLWGVWRGLTQPKALADERLNCVAATRNPGKRTVWPELWLFVWVLALLAGSSVTQESPNYLRLTALMPAVTILCARGADWALSWLAGRLPIRRRETGVAVAAVLLGVLVLGEGARTTALFFDDWAHQPGVYTAFDTDIRDAAAASARFSSIPMADTVVQLDASAPFLFFRPDSADARWAREYTTVLLLPRAGQPGLWVYSHFQQTPPLAAYLPEAPLVAKGNAYPGHPGYFLYQVDAATLDAYRAQFTPPGQTETFGGQLALRGIRIEAPAAVRPGDQVVVSLLWQALADATVNYGLSVHLEDQSGLTWAQDDRQGMLRSGWHTGDEFVSRHVLTLPKDVPPVPLRVLASAELLDPVNQPAAILQNLGSPIAVGTVQVSLAPPGLTEPSADARLLLPGLAVTSVDIVTDSVRPGDALRVTLRWLRTADVPPLTVALEAIDSRGQTVAVASGDIGYGTLPAQRLPSGVIVADPRSLTLSARTAPGPLRLLLVATDESDGRSLGQLAIGTVQVRDRPHVYTVPTMQHATAATFGDQITLLGYDLSSQGLAPGRPLTVTLYWRALRTPDRDYTVFVHLLDGQGKVAAQHDGQPSGGALPTGGWLPGEVITDRHTIDVPKTLPPGTYRLETGLYNADGGQRLLLTLPGAPDHLVLPETITVR